MKVCKFEKIKDEDEMKQVINCIQKEHPYVAVVPILAHNYRSGYRLFPSVGFTKKMKFLIPQSMPSKHIAVPLPIISLQIRT